MVFCETEKITFLFFVIYKMLYITQFYIEIEKMVFQKYNKKLNNKKKSVLKIEIKKNRKRTNEKRSEKRKTIF